MLGGGQQLDCMVQSLTGKEALKSGRVQVLFGYYGNFEK